MPITSSAKKALRNSKTKRVFNLRRKSDLSKLLKDIRTLAADNKGKEAKAMLPKVYQALDKAAKTNLIKKNTASRKKARVAALLKKMK